MRQYSQYHHRSRIDPGWRNVSCFQGCQCLRPRPPPKPHAWSVGAALLDFDNPQKVIARTSEQILKAEEDYELKGDINDVIFPPGAVVKEGMLEIYYGGGDTSCCMAQMPLDELLSYLTSGACKV